MNNGKVDIKLYVGRWGGELLICNKFLGAYAKHHVSITLGGSYLGVTMHEFPEPRISFVVRLRYRLVLIREWMLQPRQIRKGTD